MFELGTLLQHGPHHGPMGSAGGGMGTGFAWGVTWLVVGVLVIVGVTYLLMRAADTPTSDAGADALGVLERRYARGEVDDETFEERRIRLAERDRP